MEYCPLSSKKYFSLLSKKYFPLSSKKYFSPLSSHLSSIFSLSQSHEWKCNCGKIYTVKSCSLKNAKNQAVCHQILPSELISSAISCADLSHLLLWSTLSLAQVAISIDVIIILNNQVLPSWKSSSRGSISAKIRTTEKNGLLMFNAGPGVKLFHSHMGQFLQDGENVCFVSYFFKK